MKLPIATLLAILTAGCLLWAESPKPATHPKTILIIRHGEKPSDENDIDLTPEGFKRADAIPILFKKSATRPDPFSTPDFIFAAQASRHSNRPKETVLPLAKTLKLDINGDYSNSDYPKLAEELLSNTKYDGKTVLICWHHGTIPELVTKLGATDVPDKWKDHVFDQVWVVTFDEKGKAKALVKRSQSLMSGDAKK